MNLNHVIDQVGKDKGIDRSILIETLEAAILTAARRTYGQQWEIEAEYNEETGEVELFLIMKVVDEVDDPYQEVAADELGYAAEPGEELNVAAGQLVAQTCFHVLREALEEVHADRAGQ